MNGNGTTLELDAATTSVLDHLAQAWGVSKEEAVRRAVIEAEVATAESAKLNRVEAFKELQCRLQLTPEKAAVRDARR